MSEFRRRCVDVVVLLCCPASRVVCVNVSMRRCCSRGDNDDDDDDRGRTLLQTATERSTQSTNPTISVNYWEPYLCCTSTSICTIVCCPRDCSAPLLCFGVFGDDPCFH